MGAVKGIEVVIKELRGYGKQIEKQIDAETEDIAFQIENDAKKLAPKNFGKLAQSIYKAKLKESQYTIAVNEKYAAYMEFGTGAKVRVPAGFEEMANSFKNVKGGTFSQFLEAMTIYFKAKGYDTKYVWIACINKLNNGQEPKPFLYPAFIKGKKNYLTNLNKVLDKFNKKI